MFDILLDFPDSAPAVEDLKTCLQQTSLAATCVRVFGGDVQRRLLHVGAMTGDILQAYTSTIKVLRCIDPTDVLLGAIGAPIKYVLRVGVQQGEAVQCVDPCLCVYMCMYTCAFVQSCACTNNTPHTTCTPTREYLRSRRDTIRCIVTLLTDDDAGEEGEGGPEGGLLEELRVAPPDPPMDAAEEANIDSDKQLWQVCVDHRCDGGMLASRNVLCATRCADAICNIIPTESISTINVNNQYKQPQAIEGWEPAPIDSNPDQPRGRQADIIGNLVDIYGSQELFINEYRSMLADKLLSKVCSRVGTMCVDHHHHHHHHHRCATHPLG